MTPKQRMLAINNGEQVDRIPFLPTILEHGAKLIDNTPSKVAACGDLLEKAHIKAFETYGHDAVTVGIDVYNIEAEALGCEVRYHCDNSIPGIVNHPVGEGFLSENISFSPDMGRIKEILDSAFEINRAIGSEVNVGIGICGPFSVFAELKGYESAVFSCMFEEENALAMLGILLGFQKCYCDEIIKKGLGITIFESWATSPLISPDIYRKFAMPFEKELIQHIKSRGLKAAPLVIGGDTTLIADDMIETGTTLLVADYMVDIALFAEKAAKKGLMLRANIDPKLVQNGTTEEILSKVKAVLDKAGSYEKLVLGTGVIPYDTPPENILAIREYLTNGGGSKV